MKILFLQFGTKYYQYKDRYYTDGSLNEKVWNRYLKYSNKLTALGKKLNNNNARNIDVKKLNIVPNDIDLILLEDIYNPKKNYFNFLKRRKIKRIISEKIDSSDKIVIRSITNDYNIFATKYCIKKKKDFVLEVTGFGFDSLWYHEGFLGKILAILIEIKMKYIIKKCKNVLYVTNLSLQKRYPNYYNNVGCSDVEIQLEKNIFNKKKDNYLEKFDIKNATVGTIGHINSKIKGQESVIRALSEINKEYNYNIKYELVGRGNNRYLRTIAKKYNFEKNIIFIGEMQHDKIFDWLDHLDIYIQPSFTEGLCRSLIEAISRGCLAFASDAGGNTELVSNKYIFRRGKYKDIKKVFKNFNINDINSILNQEYKIVQNYEKNKLNSIRNSFYNEFFRVNERKMK